MQHRNSQDFCLHKENNRMYTTYFPDQIFTVWPFWTVLGLLSDYCLFSAVIFFSSLYQILMGHHCSKEHLSQPLKLWSVKEEWSTSASFWWSGFWHLLEGHSQGPDIRSSAHLCSALPQHNALEEFLEVTTDDILQNNFLIFCFLFLCRE